MWRYHWHGYIASLQEVLESCPFGKETAFNIVKAAVQHNMKPDDVTVIVAKVVAVPTKEEQVNNNDEKP
jgi:protein phosphatase PTC7